MQIAAVESTDLFAGTREAPRQIVRVTLERDVADGAVEVRIAGGATGRAVAPPGAGRCGVEVPVDTAAPVGAAAPFEVIAGGARAAAVLTVEQPGWTMFLIPHFHYDPVWWNTQAGYTSSWEALSGDGTTRPLWEKNGFALVEAHLDLAVRDPDYTFVLAEIDYLKPFFDTHPHRLADLRRLVAQGRVELVGGTYNEPNTNLTGAECTIRNLVYGVGYQRDILGGDPRTAWQLDVFGHDPQFPGYLAAAGLTGSAWARGPFHQWAAVERNPPEVEVQAKVMQFPSEFEWIAPSGRGVLTHFMPGHYSAGWAMDSSPDLETAQQAVYELYRTLKPVGATRNLLLPVGTDYTPPNKWVTEIHRSWNARYAWPRFVCATPRDFLDAVRAELADRGVRPSPQSRDMNPVYTGKDVSYIDTKQAQRAGEVAAVDAEKLATLAALRGLGGYPEAALDKAWRHLAYGAHHDAITGSESDQVYIDLLSGWREAHDLASSVLDSSLAALAGTVDTRGDGTALVVTNSLSFDRSAPVAVPLPAGLADARLVDDTGARTPAVVADGVLRFLAEDVPALGWRTWRLVPGEPSAEPAWEPLDGTAIRNGRYRVVADPRRGGGLSSLVDLATGRELLRGGEVGNELRVYDEYPEHPDFGEGPWHLLPSGRMTGSAERPARVTAQRSVLGERLLIEGRIDGAGGNGGAEGNGRNGGAARTDRNDRADGNDGNSEADRTGGIGYQQTVTLWHGTDRVEFRTRIVDHRIRDRLVRVRFPVDLPGALPVSEVASAVVGRGYALPDVDVAQHPWTLDNPANTWFGLSSTARIRLTDRYGGTLGERALGVAEIVVSALDEAAAVRALVAALAGVGVTATTAAADWSRYGWLAVDSNLPDFRVVVGGPDTNRAAADLLASAGARYAAELERQVDAHGTARVWIPAATPLTEVWRPGADLRDLRALPALVVAGRDAASLGEAVAALAAEAATATLTAVSPVPPPAAEELTDHTVALLTRGLPGFAVDPAGSLHLSLLRSCTGWPSGVWIDPPRRTAPDGSSFQLQHWTHEFGYALVSGAGDWRALSLPARGQEYNHPLYPRIEPAHPGDLPARHSFLRLEPQRDVLLSTLKAAGNPIASGSGEAADPARAVTLRLVEATGLGRTATVHDALGLGAVRAADLLERPGAALPAFPEVALHPAEVATVTAVPAPVRTTTGAAGTTPLGPTAEIAQPVHTRYWLHNRGPAPLGYLPVSVTVAPGLVRTHGEPVEVTVTLATHLVGAATEGVAELVAPAGWSVTPPLRPYRIEQDAPVRFTATVTAPAGAEPGLYFVAARITHGGQLFEDVTTVALGTSDELRAILPVPGTPPADRVAFKGTSATAGRPTGLEAAVTATSRTLRPGERGAVGVRLTNRTRDEIRGEAQLVSPWGTWQWLPEPTSGFRVAAGATAELSFAVTVRPDAEPGHAWALPKIMWFGRTQYAATVRLEVVR